jgi:hypothetical protein
LKQPGNGGRTKKFKVEDLVKILGNKELSNTELMEIFIEKTKASESTFARLMREAQGENLIHKCAVDQKWEKVSK